MKMWEIRCSVPSTPGNTMCLPVIVLVLGSRRGRWAGIETAWLLFSGYGHYMFNLSVLNQKKSKI